MALAKPVYRPRHRIRTTRIRVTRTHASNEFQQERAAVLSDARRARFVKAFETTGWRNHCHEQLVFSVKAHHDSFLAVSKLNRRPGYVHSLSAIQHGVDQGRDYHDPIILPLEKAKEKQRVRFKEEKKRPEKYDQATPTWLYNLNDPQHADALLNWFIYGSAAAAGKSQFNPLPWDELRLFERQEIHRSPLPKLQVGADTYTTGNGAKCWEILEVEAVMHNNPRSVRDKLLEISCAIASTNDAETINTLQAEYNRIAADATQEAYRFASGRVRRSAALFLHIKRCVEIKTLVHGQWQTEMLPGYYVIDAGELSFPLEGMNKLSVDFAEWFDKVIQYHIDHPEQQKYVSPRRIYFEGLGPHKSILDHDFDLNTDLRDEVIIDRYAEELKRPSHQLSGKQYRRISGWQRARNPELTKDQILQLRLGKMAHRTQKLFRAKKLKAILNKSQPFLWENPNADKIAFTRLTQYNGYSELPLSISGYHPEYLKRLGAWLHGKVAWDPRWPGDLRTRTQDIRWIACLMAEARRRCVTMAWLAALAITAAQRADTAAFASLILPLELLAQRLAPVPHSRGPPD